MQPIARADYRHPRRSTASASVLVLAMGLLACLLPSRSAEAADTCQTILNDLQTQYFVTTSQLQVAISLHSGADGKVDFQYLQPALVAYATQTSAAIARLQVVANSPPARCEGSTIITLTRQLVQTISASANGARLALQKVRSSQLGQASVFIQQIDSQVVILTKLLVVICGISLKLSVATSVQASPSLVAVLQQVFPGFLAYLAS
jgi:hypothetical protein